VCARRTSDADGAESARRPKAEGGLAEVLEDARQLHELLREPELPRLPSGSDYERMRLEYRTRALRTAQLVAAVRPTQKPYNTTR